MKLTLTKIVGDCWMPGDQPTAEFSRKVKMGENIHGDFTRQRNAGFHRKLFALLNLAFEYWEPGEINSKYGVPQKNFDRFRKDLVILSGYYHIVIRLDGTAKPEADSISFANMKQETFDAMYNNILAVVMDKIQKLSKLTAEEINALADRVAKFG